MLTVSYRSLDDVLAFIESVRLSGDAVSEIVVVDNLSEQSEIVAHESVAAGARVIELDDNRGYGYAINVGEATLPDEVPYFLISNPDVHVHPGAISALTAALDLHPEAGAVGPRIYNTDGSIYPSARRIPSLRAGIGHALFSRVWPTNPWTRSYREENASADEARSVGWLSGACLMVRRSAFADVDGFDTDYFMYFEDVDLGYRLARAGWSSRYEPSAAVTHVGAQSTSRQPGHMLRVHHQSADRFLSRKYRGWYLAPVRWTLHLGLELRAWWMTRGA